MARFLVNIPAGTGAVDKFVPMFGKGYFVSAQIVNDADPGGDAVVSFSDGTTEVGTGTVANATAAGSVLEVSGNAVARANALDSDTPLKISVDGGQVSATGFDILVDIDEFARQ